MRMLFKRLIAITSGLKSKTLLYKTVQIISLEINKGAFYYCKIPFSLQGLYFRINLQMIFEETSYN